MPYSVPRLTATTVAAAAEPTATITIATAAAATQPAAALALAATASPAAMGECSLTERLATADGGARSRCRVV